MEISRHLNEEELSELVLSSAPILGSHPEHCDACLDEVTRLRGLVRQLRATGAAEEELWIGEKGVASCQTSFAPRSQRLSWALAAAMIALATLLFVGGHAPPMQKNLHAKVDPDHELLLEIERTLQTGGPEALEPAALLAREIGQQATANNRSRHDNKETTHED